MSRVVSIITVAFCVSTAVFAAADTKKAVPRLGFSNFGWFPVSDDFAQPASGAGPVVSDPAHPYYNNQSGRQPTDRVADLTSPILKPWAIERMRKTNQVVIDGKAPFSPRERCMPGGVPGVDVYSRLRPVYFLQGDKEIVWINEGDAQVRHIYLNAPHSKDPKPSWYGESIGHYENDDTLVVDTIGLNDKTFVDNYLTPHTTRLHVVERFRLMPDGKSLRADITVDDPDAFTTPWSAVQTYRQSPQAIMEEAVCAENPLDYLQASDYPIPRAEKADF
jgi:hypothetical protein